jgi:hypothetical protein
MRKIILILLLLYTTSILAFETQHKYIIWKLTTNDFYISNNVWNDLAEILNWNTIYLTHPYFLDKNLEKLNWNVLKKIKEKVWYIPWKVAVFYGDNNYFKLSGILKKYVWNNYIVWWHWQTTSIYEPAYIVNCSNDKFFLQSYVFDNWKINLEEINEKFPQKEKDFILKNLTNEFKTCKNFKEKFWLIDYSFREYKNYNKLFSLYEKCFLKKYWKKITKLSLKQKLKILSKIDNLRNNLIYKELQKNKYIKINILLDVLVKLLTENKNY